MHFVAVRHCPREQGKAIYTHCRTRSIPRGELTVSRRVHVVGVGMIPFTKPGASEPYSVMGARAARLALDDARIDYKLVEQAYVGYVYGDSTSGQAAVYGVGLTGIPVFN